MRRFTAVLLILALLGMSLLVIAPQAQAQTAWAPNTAYSVGQLVTYGGSVYKCIQAHTSQVGWEPPNVPALWALQTGTTAPTNTTAPTTAPTKTNTPGVTATKTNTPLVTSTNTSVPPTATNTSVPPTATKTTVPSATPTSGGTTAPAWDCNLAYSTGALVSYQGHIYKALVAVPAGECGWIPGSTPTVWADQGTGTSATNTPTFVPTMATATKTNTPGGPTPIPGKHVLIGYWHDFDNGTGFIPLPNVSSAFDIIVVAFAAPGTGSPNGQMVFTPYNETTAQFQADIATMHSRGKKVLISSGGYVGSTFTLGDSGSMNNFISSMESIISTYGFDGMDIDWEQNVLTLNAGDKDITHPTTPDVVNTINAITTIHNHFGSGFMLTYGMETFFVQLGYSFYGGTCSGCDTRAGSLLPVIYATRSFTNYVQVQLYNSGAITALDNQYYTNGGPDFIVAMTDMLLHGFPVAGTGQTFPALSPSQVAIGVPASTGAAGSGYVAPAGLEQAFNYLNQGISYGGAYHLTTPSGYPGLAGFMTWSINWDSYAGFTWSTPLRSYLNGLSQ